MNPLARLTIGAITIAIGLFSLGRPALAQFPRVSIDCNVQNVTPAAGSTVPFDCMVRDSFGVGVPAAPLTFVISVDTSGGASFGGQKAAIVPADNLGHVAQILQVGSKSGVVGVDVTFTGIKGWYVALKVQGAGGATTTATAPTTPSGIAPSSTTAASTLATQAAATLAGAAPSLTTAAAATRAAAPAPLPNPGSTFRPPNTGSGGLLPRDCAANC